MKNAFCLAFTLAFLSSAAFAEEPSGLVFLTQNKDKLDSVFENGELRQEIIDKLNSQAESVPEQVRALFGNKKMNVYVELDDSTVKSYWIHAQDNKIKVIAQGARADADVELKVKESVLEGIIASQNPIDSFIKAMNAGEIKYEGLSAQGKTESMVVNIIAGAANVVTGVIGFFAGILDAIFGLFR